MQPTMSLGQPRRSKVFVASLVFSVFGSLATGLLLWSAWRTRAVAEQPAPTAEGQEIRIESGKHRLAGLLVRPTTPGPHPAVVFVTDTGATDRTNHGFIPPLARRLAAQGFVCLSWDRAGVGGSAGECDMQTMQDRADEVLAGLRFIKDQPDVDRERVALAGLGQGAAVAALAAWQAGGVAGLIDISGSQVLGWEQELYRVENELRADGFHPTVVAEAMELVRLKVEVVRGKGTFGEFDETQKGLIGRPWFEYQSFCERRRFDVFSQVATYDPAPSWEHTHCPVLAVYGAKDTTVPVDASLQVLRTNLTVAGNTDLTIKVFPRADHLLTVSDTGGRKEADDRARRRRPGDGPEFAPGVFDTITSWLNARLGRRG